MVNRALTPRSGGSTHVCQCVRPSTETVRGIQTCPTQAMVRGNDNIGLFIGPIIGIPMAG